MLPAFVQDFDHGQQYLDNEKEMKRMRKIVIKELKSAKNENIKEVRTTAAKKRCFLATNTIIKATNINNDMPKRHNSFSVPPTMVAIAETKIKRKAKKHKYRLENSSIVLYSFSFLLLIYYHIIFKKSTYYKLFTLLKILLKILYFCY